MAALYSVVQFQPNTSRKEGVNVGVVIFLLGDGNAFIKMDPTNARIVRHFGAEYALDLVKLEKSKRELANRLTTSRLPTLLTVKQFIGSVSVHGSLVFFEPLPVEVSLRGASVELEVLYKELVERNVRPS